MNAKLTHLDQLLDKIQENTRQPLDWAGFGAMEEIMEVQNIEVGQRYLYNFHRAIGEARDRGAEALSLNITKLDSLARFVGFSNYRQFTERMDKPINPILSSCIGNYYSYVRQNDDKGIILRSPVRIAIKEGKVEFALKGGKWTYIGAIELTHGCLFVLMHAPGGKIIHHVYKIGAREQPIVLQGIFSGVSTGFDPIGGRAVLIRSEEKDFDKLSNKKLEVVRLVELEDAVLKNIGQYLADRNGNNLSINSIGMTWDVDDLRIPGTGKKQFAKKKAKASKPSTPAGETRK